MSALAPSPATTRFIELYGFHVKARVLTDDAIREWAKWLDEQRVTVTEVEKCLEAIGETSRRAGPLVRSEFRRALREHKEGARRAYEAGKAPTDRCGVCAGSGHIPLLCWRVGVEGRVHGRDVPVTVGNCRQPPHPLDYSAPHVVSTLCGPHCSAANRVVERERHGSVTDAERKANTTWLVDEMPRLAQAVSVNLVGDAWYDIERVADAVWCVNQEAPIAASAPEEGEIW